MSRFLLSTRTGTAALALAAVALLTGCVSETEPPGVPSAADLAAIVNLDAELAKATALKRPVVVLVIETGHSRADKDARALLADSPPVRDKAVLPVVLDISYSRNRATAARFHVVDTPLFLCLSSRGLTVSRDETPVTKEMLSQRIQEDLQKGPDLDAKLGSLEQAANRNPNDPQAQLDLANFLLAQHNAREAIHPLEAVAHNDAVETSLRLSAWVALVRAHFWIGEAEKGRHEAVDLMTALGPKTADARAGGNLVLGLQDTSTKRYVRARQEFQQAIAAAPDSLYGRQAAAELAKLP